MATNDIWAQIEGWRQEHLRKAEQLRAHELWSFWEEASHRISNQYQKILRHASEHPNTAGEQSERDWQALLRDWIPASYEIVTRGRLVYEDGATSPELDLIVLKPGYPRAMLDYKYYLADGVAGVFECKRTLHASHIREAVEVARGIQGKLPVRTGNPRREMYGPAFFGLLAHGHSWKGLQSTPIQNIEREIEEASRQVTHPRELIDIICVGDLAGWNIWKQPGFMNHLGVGWSRSIALPEDEERLKELMRVLDARSRSESPALPAEFVTHPEKWLPVLGDVMLRPGVFTGKSMPAVGFVVCAILEMLAWEDEAVRSTARLFRKYLRTFPIAQWLGGTGDMACSARKSATSSAGGNYLHLLIQNGIRGLLLDAHCKAVRHIPKAPRPPCAAPPRRPRRLSLPRPTRSRRDDRGRDRARGSRFPWLPLTSRRASCHPVTPPPAPSSLSLRE
jgi:hypothetical protein